MAGGTIASIEQSEDKYRRYFNHNDKCVHRDLRIRTAVDHLVPTLKEDIDLVKLNAMFDELTTTTVDKYGRTVEKYGCGLTVTRGRFTEARNWSPAGNQVNDQTRPNQDAKSPLLSRRQPNSRNMNSDYPKPGFSSPPRRARLYRRSQRHDTFDGSSFKRRSPPRHTKEEYSNEPVFGYGFSGPSVRSCNGYERWPGLGGGKSYAAQHQGKMKPNKTKLQQVSSPPKVVPPTVPPRKSPDEPLRRDAPKPLFGFGKSIRDHNIVPVAPVRASIDQPRMPAPPQRQRSRSSPFPLPSLLTMTTGRTLSPTPSPLGFSETSTVIIAPTQHTLGMSETTTVSVAPVQLRLSPPPTSSVESRMKMRIERRSKSKRVSELQQRIQRREQ